MPAHSPTAATIMPSAAAAFTGAWALLRAASALPGFVQGSGAFDRLLTGGAALAGAALLPAAILLARRRAGAWAAAVGLILVLLALVVTSFAAARRLDWPGALAAALALIVLVSPPVRAAYLSE